MLVEAAFARDLVRLLWMGLWASLTTAEDIRHASPWLFGDLGSHLKSQRANEPSLEPETISSGFEEWHESDFTLPVCPDKTPMHFLFPTVHIFTV
uniref:Secreted protein n=1 Tax=Arundo donax TaxID=35708 RepID=A0A0A9DAB1_ARUDO